MSKGRLTRNELSWLLTQEAQHAAERLRVGVQYLRTQAPPPPPAAEDADPAEGVETSLDALDDVMKMLSSLNQRAPSPSGSMPAARRGRIDLAALLVEVAKDARVSIEPGVGGTEVYGEEADLRRMLQVLVGQGGGEGASLTVRRDADEVKVALALGPDASPTAETERAWLSRMAIRYGGRYELDGNSELVAFPADDANDRSESDALRKELDEARKQGEAYARELAAVFDRDEPAVSVSTVPPGAAARLEAMTKLCGAVASELRGALGPALQELAAMRPHEITGEQLETLRRRVGHAQEIGGVLGAVGEVGVGELERDVDLADATRAAVRALAAAAQRGEVKVSVRVAPEGAPIYVRARPKAVEALAKGLVAHAIEASPRGAAVTVTVSAASGAAGPRLVVDDAGAALPAAGRRALVALETHAGAYGRPSGLSIFLAAELAASQGAAIELSDAPLDGGAPREGRAGGLRVAVTFREAAARSR